MLEPPARRARARARVLVDAHAVSRVDIARRSQVALDVRTHQLGASQRMVQRLHAAHAALGMRAEELDARAERSTAEAEELRVRAAGAAREGAGAQQPPAEDGADGRAQLELARRALIGRTREPARASGSVHAERLAPMRPAGTERSTCVRSYVRSLDEAIAVRAGGPAARAEWPSAPVGEHDWDDGELRLHDEGEDEDGGADAAMPMPSF